MPDPPNELAATQTCAECPINAQTQSLLGHPLDFLVIIQLGMLYSCYPVA